jgi:hypothetical protein
MYILMGYELKWTAKVPLFCGKPCTISTTSFVGVFIVVLSAGLAGGARARLFTGSIPISLKKTAQFA